jgi:hypothetical protein
MTDRKKPGLAFWATVMVACLMPILYVLSFGPACWLLARGRIPFTPTATVYRPISRWILVPIHRNKTARKCLAFGDKQAEAEMEVVLGSY